MLNIIIGVGITGIMFCVQTGGPITGLINFMVFSETVLMVIM